MTNTTAELTELTKEERKQATCRTVLALSQRLGITELDAITRMQGACAKAIAKATNQTDKATREEILEFLCERKNELLDF